ncbi:MAG: transposase [Thermodesulfobacteriota bacterium]
MARKPRIEFPGAFYHVISRGNQRQATFHDSSDYLSYLKRLEHYRKRYNLTVYAYVLMKTKELARILHPDPSVISRLYRRYAEVRDLKIEEMLASMIKC